MNDENDKKYGLTFSLKEWNEKLYRLNKFSKKSKSFSEVLWKHFKIKSWPLFKDACAYSIPDCWRSDVISMLYKSKNLLGDRVKFSQIKEKFCMLTVYYFCEDKDDDKIMRGFIRECQESLITKGLHPAEGKYE